MVTIEETGSLPIKENVKCSECGNIENCIQIGSKLYYCLICSIKLSNQLKSITDYKYCENCKSLVKIQKKYYCDCRESVFYGIKRKKENFACSQFVYLHVDNELIELVKECSNIDFEPDCYGYAGIWRVNGKLHIRKDMCPNYYYAEPCKLTHRKCNYEDCPIQKENVIIV